MQGNSQWHIFPPFTRQNDLGKRTGLKKQKAWISLFPTNIAEWIQTVPEAELCWALSCDCSVITTRWINTCVVKVKWCYVVRCYWTWHITLHDTDTFFCPSSFLCSRWGWGVGPAVIPRRGSSVEAFASAGSELSQPTTVMCPGWSLSLINYILTS